MAGLRYRLLQAGFELFALPGIGTVLRSLSRSRGVIFTLHRVVPTPPAAFSPNAILQVTPAFLDWAITRMRQLGYETVSMDEAVRRIESDAPQKRFVVFSFDDGYRDNLVHALPILKRHNCPFILYVPTALIDGVGEVWWQALEDIIAAQTTLAVTYQGETEYFATASADEKTAAYAVLYQRMRAMPEEGRVELIRALASQYGLDLTAHCRSLIMTWPELRRMASEPLCIIGAHTVRHFELSKLTPDEVRNEIGQSLRILKAEFGAVPAHFSYPIGSRIAAGEREYALARELGLRTAVTTRPGALGARHRDHLHALPRISLNGLFQARRYMDVFATPDIFSLMPS